MPMLTLLRETLRQIDEIDDFRKDSPAVQELKRHIYKVIVDLEMAQAGRITLESLPNIRQPKKSKE